MDHEIQIKTLAALRDDLEHRLRIIDETMRNEGCPERRAKMLVRRQAFQDVLDLIQP